MRSRYVVHAKGQYSENQGAATAWFLEGVQATFFLHDNLGVSDPWARIAYFWIFGGLGALSILARWVH